MIQLRRFPIAPAFVRFTADQLAAIELVISHVHPGNLGALPPAPDMLLYKARQIGLL